MRASAKAGDVVSTETLNTGEAAGGDTAALASKVADGGQVEGGGTGHLESNSESGSRVEDRLRRLETAVVSIDNQLRDLVGLLLDLPAVSASDVERAFEKTAGHGGDRSLLKADLVRHLVDGPAGLSSLQVKSVLRKVPVDPKTGEVKFRDVMAWVKGGARDVN